MIKIRVVVLLLLCWVLSGTAFAYPLTTEQRLDELEYLLQMIEENYPFLWSNERVLGLDWLGKREEFRGMVAATADDAQYYQAISRLLSTLQNAHTHLISPQSFPLFVRDYRNTQPWVGTMTEEVHQAYQYWQKIIGESSIVPPFYARYIAGEYMVVASSNEALPIGALLLEVDGQPVHEYVSGCYDRVELRLDPLRNQMYAPYMPIPSMATVKLTFKLNDRIQQVVLDTAGSHPPSPGRQQDNVTCDILEADQTAYLRIRSFRREYEQVDEPVIRDFLTSVRHYPNLIIDIRGNSGGAVSYWQKLLVAPLIHRTVAADVFLTIRSGQYVQDFLKARIGLGYHFLKVNRGSLASSLDLPCEMLTERFIEPIKLPTIVRPRQPVGFSGRIFLLVDDLVYSSAEAFALFARQTGWATLIGTRTGGDGVGIDPFVFSLPHSGLLVRMAQSLGLNPDGSVNNETGTQPHYYVELATDEYATLVQEGRLTGTYPALDRILRCAMELTDTTSVVPQAPHEFLSWVKDLGQDMFTPPMGLSSLYQGADISVYNGYCINEVLIYGAFTTNEELLRRLVGYKRGDLFTAEDLQLLQARLNHNETHRSITVVPRPVGEKTVNIVVYVDEGTWFMQSPWELGYRLVNDLATQRVSLRYLNAGGQMVDLSGVWGLGPAKERLLSVKLPVTSGLQATLSAGTYSVSRQAILGPYAGQSWDGKRTQTKINATAVVRPDLYLSLASTYLLDGVEPYLDTSVTLNYGLAGPVHTPYGGRASVCVGMLKGESDYYPYAAYHVVGSKPLSKSTIIALWGSAGYRAPDTPFAHLFFQGGTGSLEAYNPILACNRFVTMGAQLRFCGPNNLSLVLLADGGSVWDASEPITFDQLRSSAGIALQWLSPVGFVLEAKYARSLTDPGIERFTFGLCTQY